MRETATQRHRLNRVVNFAQSNISEPISLDDLADVACLSKYHFTRLFRTYHRETPLAFLWRLRLEQAARRLAFAPENRITDITFECGFTNPEALSHAFRRRFGLSPTAFRNRYQCALDGFGRSGKLRQSVYIPPSPKLAFETQSYPVKIENRPDYPVCYIRHCGPYGDVNNSISQQFELLKTWACTRGLSPEKVSFIGLSRSTPSITPVRHCIFDVCVVVPVDFEEDEIVSKQIIPGGDHAVLGVSCLPQDLYHAWKWLLSSWLPGSRYTYRHLPVYEFSPPDEPRETKPGNIYAELCLPVSKR